MALKINPKPAFFNISGETSILPNQVHFYTVPENTEVTYDWIVENGGKISDPTPYSAEIQWHSSGEGAIYVISMNEYGCISDTYVLKVQIGSTNIQSATTNEIMLYPNPVTSILNLKSAHEIFEIDVVDLSGKTLLSSRQSEIDLSFLKRGAYIGQRYD